MTHIDTTKQAAMALRPIAGDFAFLIFAFGIIGTGLLSLPVLAGSAAYALSSFFQLRKRLSQPFSAAQPFYALLAAAMVVGVVTGVAGIDPFKALYWAAVINAVISVPIMIAVIIVASHRDIMGDLVLSRRWKILGLAATAAMAAMAVATLAMHGSALT